ncbi:MAG: hypothetical protein VXW58_09530 [Pseudomonadota bacterium]|nr:hypothetical protein [Pseudomonadota bacterium]
MAGEVFPLAKFCLTRRRSVAAGQFAVEDDFGMEESAADET